MTAELPISIVWSKTLFPEGSLGRTVFPNTLEGRERSSEMLSRSARLYVRGIKRWSRFEEADIATVKDLLTLEEVKLASWLKRPQSIHLQAMRRSLSDDLQEVIVGPEDELMRAIFRGGVTSSFIIPPSLEPARRERIIKALESLPDEQNHIIQSKFGITTFTPKPFEEIAEEYNATHQGTRHMRRLGTRQFVDRALSKLRRNPSMRKELREFLPIE